MTIEKGTVCKPQHISKMIEPAKISGIQTQDTPDIANITISNQPPEYLRIFDSRTCNIHHIPIVDGFVRGSDLSTIIGPVNGSKGRLQKLAVLDPGFQHTACKESDITFIDGENGILLYRGVRIEDLFHNYDFDATLHLLVWGRLPNSEEKNVFEQRLAKAANPPQEVCDVIRTLPRTMDFVSMFLTGLSTYMGTDDEMTKSRHQAVMTYHNNLPKTDDAIIRCFAYVSATVAICYCHIKNVEFHAPQQGLTLVENFLHMIGMEDPDKRISRTIDRLSMNLADHGLSCSTAAFLHVASSMTDPMTCLLAAISAGSGPLHAGALEICYQELERIGSVDNVPAYIAGVKTKKFRLFGYGHRVYKTQDPRAALTKELIEEHWEAIEANPLLQIAIEIDKQANTDPYFVERKLKLNADFYGCFIYIALGIPREVIPGLLTISRMGGFMAHWRESMTNPMKLWRPMQKYKLRTL